MEYSIVGIIALAVCLILNFDVLFKRPVRNNHLLLVYKIYLVVVSSFFTIDIAWGLVDLSGAVLGLYVVSYLYFITMALTVLSSTIVAALYLGRNSTINKVIYYIGIAFFVFIATILIVNLFTPIVFEIDANGVYHAHWMRYLLYSVQIAMFLLTAIYSFIMVTRTHGITRNHYLAITFFGVVMASSILAQTAVPLMPVYASGCLVGIAIVHTFVVSDEKQEASKKLESALQREIAQKQEINEVRNMAYKDPLTGAQSKYAYVEMIEDVDSKIANNELKELAVISFDVNDLKLINDTEGHDAGDCYLKDCYSLLEKHFKGIPIYRFGGDEFVAVLSDDCYQKRKRLLSDFEKQIDHNLESDGRIIISSGMSEFRPNQDNTYRAIFMRADKQMYARKERLKSERD